MRQVHKGGVVQHFAAFVYTYCVWRGGGLDCVSVLYPMAYNTESLCGRLRVEQPSSYTPFLLRV